MRTIIRLLLACACQLDYFSLIFKKLLAIAKHAASLNPKRSRIVPAVVLAHS
jgi:hypothetical protein